MTYCIFQKKYINIYMYIKIPEHLPMKNSLEELITLTKLIYLL